jgi:hypothetical protein
VLLARLRKDMSQLLTFPNINITLRGSSTRSPLNPQSARKASYTPSTQFWSRLRSKPRSHQLTNPSPQRPWPSAGPGRGMAHNGSQVRPCAGAARLRPRFNSMPLLLNFALPGMVAGACVVHSSLLMTATHAS